MNHRCAVLLAVAAGVALELAASSPLAAVEPAKEFLDGLRQRKYYDLAIEYLDTVPDNPAVPIQFKETLAYERGVTLVEGARWQRDPAIRDKWLDEGQKVLTEFVNSQKASLLAVGARSQLANVIVERAKSRLEKSKKQVGEAKDQLLIESRKLFEEAIKIFEGQVNETRERLKTYPASLQPKDGKLFEERGYFRTEYLQARMLVVAAKEEMAGTYAKDSAEFAKLITECVDGYKAIHDDYRTLLAGMFARAYQARCLQKLGKHKEALGYFNELLAQPDSSELHEMRVLAASLAIDSWIAEKLYKEVLDKAFPLIDKARPNEDRTDEFMEMRVKIARAFKLYAEELKATAPRDPLIKQLLTKGRELVLYVARFNSPYQDQARRLVADFAGADPDAVAKEKPDPKSFVEARDAGTDAITKMTNSELVVKQVEARLPTITDAGERSQLQKQVDEAKAAAADARTKASHYWKLALKLADAGTAVDDLNLARYMECYLSHVEGRHYEAVVLGEFLSQRYPDSQGARQAAKIAMASWLKIYADAGKDNEFESQRIIDVADYIVKKWPDQPEASDALNTLIPFMIRAKKLKEAIEYLSKIPADSPHRGPAELKTGQALWASYLDNAKEVREWEQDATKMPEGTDLAARKKELEDLKTKAQTALQDGVARMQSSGEMNPIGATAVLSLAQILLDTNQPEKSIALLEDAKLGSLTLLKQNHPATQKEGFDVETYKTALRAYISGLGSTNDAQPLIDKAKQMMETLKSAMGQAGQAKLVAIYVSLARDLQTQMELADDDAKQGLAKGFEAFLKEVAAEATEANVLYWVADTYRAMGESFLSSGKQGRAAAMPHLESAIATYQKILDQVGKNPPSPTLPRQIRLQMARTYRSMNKFIEAVNQYEEVLRPATGRLLLPVQIEAAQTYQEWAGFGPKFMHHYEEAILGAKPDKTNSEKAKQTERIIWGWGEIARKTSGNPKYLDQFHEARYNLALCRYKWAMMETNAAKKAERLKQAKADIALTVALYHNLAGTKWEGQSDKLLRDVQKDMGEQPAGLQALRRAEPAAGGEKGKTKGAAPALPRSTPTVKPPITNTSTK
jgi:hypothetical protein